MYTSSLQALEALEICHTRNVLGWLRLGAHKNILF